MTFKLPNGCDENLEFFEGVGGFSSGPILKNPGERGVIGQIPSVGRMDIFWNYTLHLLSWQSS